MLLHKILTIVGPNPIPVEHVDRLTLLHEQIEDAREHLRADATPVSRSRSTTLPFYAPRIVTGGMYFAAFVRRALAIAGFGRKVT